VGHVAKPFAWCDNNTDRNPFKGLAMTEEEMKALKQRLAAPHRIQNRRVLYDTCRRALSLIEALEAKPKRGRPPKVKEEVISE
jgi:hypothetical protein